jgi:catalase
LEHQPDSDLVSLLFHMYNLINICPAHAKGILFSGTFTPTSEAGKLSTAPHFTAPRTSIWVRFSNSTGIPHISDKDGNADPRGIAIRFNLGDEKRHKHTDIICHSTPFFPTRTGEGFLQFLQALKAGTIGEFLGATPSALAFVQAPKPAPISYGTQEYFSVTAFKLIDSAGKATFIRYHVVPELGVQTLSAEEVAAKDSEYLHTDIKSRVEAGPVSFKILAQVAEDGDVTDDATIHWPESRKVVELGTVKIEGVLGDNAEDNAKEQKNIIFDPIPRIEGVEPSDDPLLEMRAALYLWSGKQRRAA